MSFALAIAKIDYDAAVTRFPSSIPSSWAGMDATSCQLALDNASALLAGLPALFDTAVTAVGVVEAWGSSEGSGS